MKIGHTLALRWSPTDVRNNCVSFPSLTQTHTFMLQASLDLPSPKWYTVSRVDRDSWVGCTTGFSANEDGANSRKLCLWRRPTGWWGKRVSIHWLFVQRTHSSSCPHRRMYSHWIQIPRSPSNGHDGRVIVRPPYSNSIRATNSPNRENVHRLLESSLDHLTMYI